MHKYFVASLGMVCSTGTGSVSAATAKKGPQIKN